ncbi:MAG TPA: carboxyl transferase domain-containing protein [Acidimicrobiales bacterium]|jgi:acetyl-CoA carboxylase carboxyltransferase component
MQRLRSHIDTASEEYLANLKGMEALLHDVMVEQARVVEGGGPKYVGRHRERGKLLVRERIDLLVDQEAWFLELSPLAGWGTDDPLGGGLVTGIGVVSGVECLIAANDPTVLGGSLGPTAVTKVLRGLEIARCNRLPVINLVESGGGELPKQAQFFVRGGSKFRRMTQLSAAGVPVISVVFGSSTAGGAYVPGMSDYTVLQRSAARVYLGGPPLVKMAIDEDADDETLGGAEMHARTSGLADYLAESEPDAIRIGREVVAHLNWRKQGPGRRWRGEEPFYDPGELLGIPSADVRVPFDGREVIARIVDGSRFEEFKPLYGGTLVCGWAFIHGFPIGILANNGILFSEEAQKGASFIQLCDRIDVPLLFLQNITGFMVGTRYEHGGIIKDGAKLINAVSNSSVPHFTVMVGASYGAGNYGMAGQGYDPRFIFTWPNHRIAVMGPKQLAGVMSIVTRGRDPEAVAALEAQVEHESTALFATGQQWDDGIVDPRQTRTVLGVALSAADNAPIDGSARYGVFRM